jgi:hypothetical protein
MGLLDNLQINKIKLISYLTLFIFIIISIIVFTKNPYHLVSKYPGYSIIITLLLGFLIITSSDFIERRDQIFQNLPKDQQPSLLGFILKAISSVSSIFIIIFSILIIIYAISNFSLFISNLIWLLGILSIFGAIAIVYKLFGNKIKDIDYKSPVFIRLIKNIILYIPCLLIDFSNFIAKEVFKTPKSIWILFAIEILLILGFFFLPKIFNKIMILASDHTNLLKEPVYLNNPIKLAEQSPYLVSKSKNYKYGISFWFYINSNAYNTRKSYTKLTPLLTYGEKTQVFYDGIKEELVIKALTERDNIIEIIRTKIPYQKWNNLVINYDSGYMDIFLNNNLLISKWNIIPYMSFDSISAGIKDGIEGGLANINFYPKPLTKNQISWNYHSFKNLTTVI